MIAKSLLMGALTLMVASVFAAPAEDPEKESRPFRGIVPTIPGVVEAENFDEGPPMVAYYDVDEVNHGAKDYREETQVDIEARPDASNGHGIGWIRETEWLIYTVDVTEAGKYRLEIPVASNKQGGIFHIQFNGEDVTGPITIPDTGGWDKLETVEVQNVTLKAGRQKMKIMMDKDGESGGVGDIDLVRFIAQEEDGQAE